MRVSNILVINVIIKQHRMSHLLRHCKSKLMVFSGMIMSVFKCGPPSVKFFSFFFEDFPYTDAVASKKR